MDICNLSSEAWWQMIKSEVGLINVHFYPIAIFQIQKTSPESSVIKVLAAIERKMKANMNLKRLFCQIGHDLHFQHPIYFQVL